MVSFSVPLAWYEKPFYGMDYVSTFLEGRLTNDLDPCIKNDSKVYAGVCPYEKWVKGDSKDISRSGEGNTIVGCCLERLYAYDKTLEMSFNILFYTSKGHLKLKSLREKHVRDGETKVLKGKSNVIYPSEPYKISELLAYTPAITNERLSQEIALYNRQRYLWRRHLEDEDRFDRERMERYDRDGKARRKFGYY